MFGRRKICLLVKAQAAAQVRAAAPRLSEQLRRFRAASHGVWRGGAPARFACRFVRNRYPRHGHLNFLMEAVWSDTAYLGRANLVPNTAHFRFWVLGGAPRFLNGRVDLRCTQRTR